MGRLEPDLTEMQLRPFSWRSAMSFVAAAPIALVLSACVLHGPVDGERLSRSVTNSTGSVGRYFDEMRPCTPAEQGRWHCRVMDSAGSGAVTYEVQTRGGSCWTARMILDDGEPMPARAEGCVHLWQW